MNVDDSSRYSSYASTLLIGSAISQAMFAQSSTVAFLCMPVQGGRHGGRRRRREKAGETVNEMMEELIVPSSGKRAAIIEFSIGPILTAMAAVEALWEELTQLLAPEVDGAVLSELLRHRARGEELAGCFTRLVEMASQVVASDQVGNLRLLEEVCRDMRGSGLPGTEPAYLLDDSSMLPELASPLEQAFWNLRLWTPGVAIWACLVAWNFTRTILFKLRPRTSLKWRDEHQDWHPRVNQLKRLCEWAGIPFPASSP